MGYDSHFLSCHRVHISGQQEKGREEGLGRANQKFALITSVHVPLARNEMSDLGVKELGNIVGILCGHVPS